MELSVCLSVFTLGGVAESSTPAPPGPVQPYLAGAWGAAVLRLRGGEVGSALQAPLPGLGSHWPEPPRAMADLALIAASVLAGGSVEAPREAGNGLQLAAGRRPPHACHCCCWRECWWQ